MSTDEEVTVPASAVSQYAAVSLYNSPFTAHDEGRALDLYPGARRQATAQSPVTGTVRETLTLNAPSKRYAVDQDHLIVIDTGARLARILHVEPVVESGEHIEVGDTLGTTVRSGYFDPWVADHLHLGFRAYDSDPRRARGSLPIDLGVDVDAVTWDGTGIVVDRTRTAVRLDGPPHPAPGEVLAGIAAETDSSVRALDGGFPHYENGGVIGESSIGTASERVTFLGTQIGKACGRGVTWGNVEVEANGERVYGLSLALRRDNLDVILVDPDGVSLEVGDHVAVQIRHHAEDRA